MLQVFEFKLRSEHDPDGRRASAVVNASIAREQARAFRRLLWRRIAVLCLLWYATATTPFLTTGAAAGGFAVLGAAAVGGGLFEWRAVKRLSRLLTAADGTVRSSPPCSV